MRPRPRHPQPPAGKINVTPLIDVVMVLIIFYLIVGKLASDRKAKVDLPPSRIGVSEDTGRVLAITVQNDTGKARILVDGSEVRPGELEGVLRTVTGRQVQIRADKGLEYGAISPFIAACRAAGLASVKLVADRQGGAP